MTDAAEMLEAAAAAGVHRIVLPAPFAIESVNAWLIEDDPLTLVDCGPAWTPSLAALEDAVAELGHAVEDVELVVVTHQHVDHFGLASALVRRTGCRLGCIAPLAPRLADHWAQSRADERFVRGELRRHGIPPEADGPTARLADSLRYWADAVEADLILEDGDALPLAGRRIVAMHRPGHSPSDTVLWDADRRMLWTGDHLLGRISSNPLIARPLGDGAPPHRALIAYIASMRATAELDAELVLPGHHDPIADHRSLVEGRVGFHEERAVHIHGLLAERPAGAFDLALRIWGDRCYSQAFLVVSEIVAHLELLAERGLVVEGSSATGSVYAAV